MTGSLRAGTLRVYLKELMKLVLDEKEIEQLLLLAVNQLYDLPAISLSTGYRTLPTEITFELDSPFANLEPTEKEEGTL